MYVRVSPATLAQALVQRHVAALVLGRSLLPIECKRAILNALVSKVELKRIDDQRPRLALKIVNERKWILLLLLVLSIPLIVTMVLFIGDADIFIIMMCVIADMFVCDMAVDVYAERAMTLQRDDWAKSHHKVVVRVFY